MALHSLYCADVPLRNCSLTHSPHLLNETADSMFWLFITTSVNGNYPRVTGIAVNDLWNR